MGQSRKNRINHYLSDKYNSKKEKIIEKKRNILREKKVACEIINVHGEKIILPTTYPGKLYVHIHLNPDRHLPIDTFSDEDFLKIYKFHRIRCYGK